jgi:hypothetical protein
VAVPVNSRELAVADVPIEARSVLMPQPSATG